MVLYKYWQEKETHKHSYYYLIFRNVSTLLILERNANDKEIKSVPKDEKEKFIILGREIGTRIKEVQPRIQQLEEDNRELQRLAQRDGLTGISNRRYFDLFLYLPTITG